MYIISKYKDYYDSVAYSKGIDKTIIYKREIVELLDKRFTKDVYKKTEYFFPNMDYSSNRSNKIDGITSFIIGFCGKLYPVMVIEKRVGRLNDKVKEIVYDIDLMREYSDNYISKWHGNFDDFLNLLNDKDILNIFQDNKVPCFILKESKVNYFNRNYALSNNLILNPCLKDLEFYKIMDSASAFQEIEMYISGVIGCSENKIIEVSDKSKIEGHGFDYKKSFRKEKEKK